jgi:NAD(P)H-dependent flavin oxidoreductase YrpB (nitropropane dioxygenase family)
MDAFRLLPEMMSNATFAGIPIIAAGGKLFAGSGQLVRI